MVTGKQGTKRKLMQKTLEEKHVAIMEVEKRQKSKTEIAKMFNISKNMLTGLVKNDKSIKEGYAKFGPKRRVMRTGQFDDLESAMLKWFTSVRDCNIPLSGPLLLEKAKSFAQQLRITEFKQSTGWLDRFKERHDITFKSMCGEAMSVDTASADMTGLVACLPYSRHTVRMTFTMQTRQACFLSLRPTRHLKLCLFSVKAASIAKKE